MLRKSTLALLGLAEEGSTLYEILNLVEKCHDCCEGAYHHPCTCSDLDVPRFISESLIA
jgi:hypothetical protein